MSDTSRCPRFTRRNSSSARREAAGWRPRTCAMRENVEKPMSDHLRFRLRACAVAVVAALMGYAWSAGANEVCQGVPTELDEQAARDAFDAADVAALVQARAPLEAALDDVCKGSRDS